MLFDLRSPHRRRVIKIVYVFLALLIGVGLVGFGVGTGSNLNPFSSAGGGGGGANGEQAYINALASAEKQANAAPGNPASWAKAGTAAYALATLQPVNFDPTLGYSTKGHAALAKLKQAWTSYLALAPARPDAAFATEVVNAFGTPPPNGSGIGDYKTAESAQEVVTSSRPNLYTQYEFLAYYAYLAHEISRGDLAGARAIALAPKSAAKQVRSTLASLRAAATGATGATG